MAPHQPCRFPGSRSAGVPAKLRKTRDNTQLELDTLTIQDLAGRESLEVAHRYARSAAFQGSLRFYEAPPGQE
jgi:hypothetical protein